MIKSALVAMTILGCNCEQNTCEYVRTAGVPSASMAECQSRMKAEIDSTNAEYPLVVAVCENLPEPSSCGSASQTVALDDDSATGEPPRRSILVRARDRYSAIMSTARDGLGNAAEFVTIPASWLQRQISAVEELALVGRGSRSYSGAFRCASGQGKNGRGPAGAVSRHAIVPILRREIHGRDRHRKVGAVIERIDDRHRPSNGLNEAGPDRHRQPLEIVLMLARHACRLFGVAAGNRIDDRLVTLGDLEEVEPFDQHGDRGSRLDLQRLPDVEQQAILRQPP